MKTFNELCQNYTPCSEGVTWGEAQDITLEELWYTCPNGCWLHWWLVELDIDVDFCKQGINWKHDQRYGDFLKEKADFIRKHVPWSTVAEALEALDDETP